jgi:hypothetical protein
MPEELIILVHLIQDVAVAVPEELATMDLVLSLEPAV